MDLINNLSLTTLSTKVLPLSQIAQVLQDGMAKKFREVKVDIAACPCLTRQPYNLAGVGLSGNPSLLEIGGHANFVSNYDYDTPTWKVQNMLASGFFDSFIFGSGYAAKPNMPYNGHLIINATYRAPSNFTNASRIVFAEASNGQKRIEMLTDPNQMLCSYMGSFFISDGRPGLVLRVRAKDRISTDLDIITIMQNSLYEHFGVNEKHPIVLGGVLRMWNGRAVYSLMSEEYPQRNNQIHEFSDFNNKWFQYHEMKLKTEVAAVGILTNRKPDLMYTEQRYSLPLWKRRNQFHFISDYAASGEFIGDTTPDETEYEGYFNLAKKYIIADIVP
ncbi:PREDICTED: ester hydrolase C11orf54 homolog [Wasmannia auropunctata]|uniref:ester hydrolase C11orf54 homolog n=1 Tax=Wasmannia auropunctata TaxID=64793 RepID=UPI0005EE2B7E|nr:PREDICTED: ester hydrolase C11orf54 homolog [Wasmannia auropunctata]